MVFSPKIAITKNLLQIKCLISLKLRGIGITDESLEDLIVLISNCKLAKLDLSCNDILTTDDITQKIAGALSSSNLLILLLADIGIIASAKDILISILTKSSIRILKVSQNSRNYVGRSSIKSSDKISINNELEHTYDEFKPLSFSPQQLNGNDLIEINKNNLTSKETVICDKINFEIIAEILNSNVKIRHLDLSYCNIKNIQRKIIFENKFLVYLNLEGNQINNPDLIHLLLSIYQLEILNLANNSIDSLSLCNINQIIINPNQEKKLLSLSLNDNKIDDSGLSYLKCLIFPKSRLLHLNLTNNAFNSHVINDLLTESLNSNLIKLESEFIIEIKSLEKLTKEIKETSLYKFSRIGLQFFSKLLLSTNVIKLDFGRTTEFRSYPFIELIPNFINMNLRELNLANNLIDCEDLRIFFKILPGMPLRILNLNGNLLNIEFQKLLFQLLPKTNLSKLELSSTGLQNEGIEVLSLMIHQTKLIHLNIQDNNAITIDTINVLFNNSKKSFLIILLTGKVQDEPLLPQESDSEYSLAGLSVLDIDITILSQNIGQSRIKKLNLAEYKIKDIGASILCQKLPKDLVTLNLIGNDLGPRGAKIFFEHIHYFYKLQVLILENNSIDGESLKSLSEGKNYEELHLGSLNLSSNNIDKIGLSYLDKWLPQMNQLTYLDLKKNNFNKEDLELYPNVARLYKV